MNLSLSIFHDEETAKEWGWVQVRWEAGRKHPAPRL
jgi:hypothetical protein